MTAATLTDVVYVIAAVVLVVVLVAAAAVMVRRRSTPTSAPTAPAVPVASSHETEQPMTGLEAALAQVTGRDGRPIGESIDAEAHLVDELRVPDDTGPVLRRALDRVEHHDSPDGDVGH